jgi:hypothetical protein
MTQAFVHYFELDGHLEGSALIKTRFEHSTNYKIPLDDIARYEVGNTIGILTNTVPGSFWVIYHLYSNPLLWKNAGKSSPNSYPMFLIRLKTGKKL